MNIAIMTALPEVRKLREVIPDSVLHDEEPTLFYQPFADDDLRYLLQIRQIVRGIGKDQVELLGDMLQIFEYICLYEEQLFDSQ